MKQGYTMRSGLSWFAVRGPPELISQLMGVGVQIDPKVFFRVQGVGPTGETGVHFCEVVCGPEARAELEKLLDAAGSKLVVRW